MNWIFWNIRGILPNWVKAKLYRRAGLNWGDAESYIYMGECIGYDKLVYWYATWHDYRSENGYHVWSHDAFILVGGGYTDSFLEAERMLIEDPRLKGWFEDESDKAVPGPEQSGN